MEVYLVCSKLRTFFRTFLPVLLLGKYQGQTQPIDNFYCKAYHVGLQFMKFEFMNSPLGAKGGAASCSQ